ncbi:ChaN family lipoprotein [Taylorella equigenitalis]|uniref:Haem-binding uptake Tiki superfamily ChaN domain-containing protein n=3 Tax=Taylorella equigenitalis TaxID=29575 RepID=A0A654KF01_TAYEM|nr:ChaN family lipoprotein [Taylorella equigenitalis]ADU90991.1 hypothetical protein TEQUI_0032 [Taylorella equigenitalis MCE9]AFN36097.1 putative lipoprotein [Taylorella equigenitalis ATCC 35865]ASY30733.1 hypothetical protein B9Z30_05050 [Taylorella equigenitalis]ASY38032.1 hypothetical protein CA605_04940 [Taylorella equigenitalis]ASY39510.1 hypothetical protein CA604_05165 [Taylorella equigenitalis]
MKVFVIIATLFLSACTAVDTATNHVSSERTNELKVYDSNSKKYVEYQQFINELINSDIVLIGEIHTDNSHHQIERQLLVDISKHKKTSVVLEMGDVTKQSIWDRVKSQGTQVSTDQLPKFIEWDNKWDYSLYKSLVEEIFYSNMTPIAGNLSPSEIETIYNGAEPIYGTISTSDKVRNLIKTSLLETHQITDQSQANKLVEIQQYKDRRMADKLVKSKNLSVLIAGRLHTNKSVGVPLHIIEFDKTKKYKVIFLGDESDAPEIRNSKFTDFYIDPKISK